MKTRWGHMHRPPTKIVVNALSAKSGGGQVYLVNLLRRVARERMIDVIVLCAPSEADLFTQESVRTIPCEWAGKNLLQRILWERFALRELLEKLTADVYLAPGGTLGTFSFPLRCKSVVMFRNMLPFNSIERKRYPLGYIRSRLWVQKYLQKKSFERADLVIVLSHYAQELIHQLMPDCSKKTVVITHGLDDRFRCNETTRTKPTWVPHEYVLYVSILDFYKAQVEVVKSWARLRAVRDTPEKLLLIGPENPAYAKHVRHTISSLGLEKEVMIMGHVPHEELPAIYQHAKINIFASSCENCPHILLEALGSGRPVLCSQYPPMPEFAEKAAVYFDPYNSEELADLLIRYLDDQQWLTDMGKSSLRQSKKFRLDELICQTWETLRSLINR